MTTDILAKPKGTPEVEALRRALQFYAKHGAGCRLIHSGGNPSRTALNDDGGKIAQRALDGVIEQ